MRTSILLAVILFVGQSACTRMTLSNQAPIDFSGYRKVAVEDVRVESSGADISGLFDARDYLVNELAHESGFAEVIRDPTVDTDAVLRVTLTVTRSDDPKNDIHPYECHVSYSLSNKQGLIVDGDDEYESSATAQEAAEDCLDQIAAHYLAAYRL